MKRLSRVARQVKRASRRSPSSRRSYWLRNFMDLTTAAGWLRAHQDGPRGFLRLLRGLRSLLTKVVQLALAGHPASGTGALIAGPATTAPSALPSPRPARLPDCEARLTSGLLGPVADGFDVVAVRVAHEGTVVGGVIFRPEAGLMQHLGASILRGSKEGPHGGPVGRREREVRLTEALPSRLLRDPEIWLVADSETDGPAEVHQA